MKAPDTTMDAIAAHHRSFLQKLASARLRNRALGVLRQPWRPITRRVFPHLYANEEPIYKAALRLPPEIMSRLEQLPPGFITGYSLRAETVNWMYRFIRANNIATVIELGCGVSTIVIALALQQNGARGRFLSLESEKGWLAKTDDALRKVSLGTVVDLRFGPLEHRSFDGNKYQIHQVEDMEHLKADLLFVDAPPREVGRAGALFRFYPMLKDGAYVILDDAQREGELSAVQEWVNNGIARFEQFVPVGCGLAVLKVVKPRTGSKSDRAGMVR